MSRVQISETDHHLAGEARYGEPGSWRLRCPSCGHAFTVAECRAVGAPEAEIGRACIGVWIPGSRPAIGPGAGPCCYALEPDNIVVLAPVEIIDAAGRAHPVFDFADDPLAPPPGTEPRLLGYPEGVPVPIGIYHDPNVVWGRKTLRLTFAQWDYVRAVDVVLEGNIPALSNLATALSILLESCPDTTKGMGRARCLELTRPDGSVLESAVATESELMDLLVRVELVSVEPMELSEIKALRAQPQAGGADAWP